MSLEAAASLRCALLRNVVLALEQPLNPDRTAAITQLLVGNGLLSAGPDGLQGGLWAPVTELQGKLVEQLLKLLSKAEPPFRPAAAILLGSVCRLVPVRSFLASHGEWSTVLLEALRKDAAPGGRAAALMALTELFTRVAELLEVPGVRRDASGAAGRTLQLATPLLADAGCRWAALCATRAVLQALPTVARNHAAALEAQLAAIMAAPLPAAASSTNAASSDAAGAPTAAAAAGVSLKVRSAAAAAVALLPRALAADADAWSSTARRTLLSLHTALDVLLYAGGAGEGPNVADGGLGARAREQLEAPPAPAGAADTEGLLGAAGFVSGAGGGAAAARPGIKHTIQVAAGLFDCLEALLTRGSTSAVPVPSHAVLLLIMRLLKLDAAVLLAPGRVAPSSSAQAEVLAALPWLHGVAWGLLSVLCCVVRSALMPLMALVCRLVAEQLRRIKAGGAGGLSCVMPAAVRCCLYDTTVLVLRTGGLTAGRALAVEAAGMLVTELYGLSAVQQQQQQQAVRYGGSAMAAGARLASPLGGQPPSKKAKTGGASGTDPLAAMDLATAAAVAAEVAPVASAEDAAAQVAALAVAEALLQVAGPALPSELRGQLDALCFHMATVTSDAALRVCREPGGAAAARAGEVAALRLAAVRALAASLEAPWPSRSPFLAEGLALLQEGAAGGGGPELAAACSEGLLALEGLLRPRGVPLGLGSAGLGSTGMGGGAGGSAAAAAGQGLELPRPRMWSMLDPVQPQLPPQQVIVHVPAPVAQVTAPAAAPAAKATPGPAAQPEVAAGPSGGRQADGKHKAETEAMEVDTNGSAVAAESEAPTPSQGVATAAGKRVGKAAAKAATASSTPGLPAVTAPVASEGRRGRKAAAAAATPAAATPHAPPPASVPAAAPAAAVFGDESEDSEGSLPEIDSGDESGSGEDE